MHFGARHFPPPAVNAAVYATCPESEAAVNFARPDVLLALATDLAAEPGLAGRLPASPDHRAWLRLDTRTGTAAWLIAWPPGAGTAWHDHGGAAGAMVALAGTLTERSIEAPARHPAGEPLPLPGGTGRVRALAAGHGRAFTGRHIHEVANEGSVTAYSVHVYAPDLALMRHYVAVGETLRLIGSETDRDW
jgi:predicted metal-dependent enzyme (double-stranded beta helix superfamily)